MLTTLTRQLLVGVDRRLSNENRWSRNTCATRADGRRVRMFSDEAHRVCFEAAIRIEARRTVVGRWKARRAANAVIQHVMLVVRARGYLSPPNLNDEAGYMVVRQVIAQALAMA